MKKYNVVNCLMVTIFLGHLPSVAGTLASFGSASYLDSSSYARDVEVFTIAGESFLALAMSTGDSKIYKWNGSAYAEPQTVPTNDAYDWEFFTIDTNAYLVVANSDEDSVIYQWNATGGSGSGAFEVFQTIALQHACGWEFFRLGSDSYLVGANHWDGSTYATDSVIYKWGTNNQFEFFQNIATVGAFDWKFFTIDTESFLAVANYRNAVAYNIDSTLYRWNGLQFEVFQTIPTLGARDWEFFTIGSESFLAVANHYDNRWDLNSIIYKWDGSAFAAYQSIPTQGAADWEFFTLANEAFLVVANYGGGNTHVFKYDGTAFTTLQIISNADPTGVAFFSRGSESFLANALNANASSNLFKANLSNDPTATIHDASACLGQDLTLGLDAWGEPPLSYQWQFYGEDIPDATEETYTIPVMGQRDEGIYECIVSNDYGSGRSNALTLTLIQPILLETPPHEITSCQGASVTFDLAVHGLNLRYQWSYNDVNIPGAIHPTYTLENLSSADEGAYSCVISDVCSSMTTQPVTLTVSNNTWFQLELPEIFNVPGGQVAIPISLSGVDGASIDGFTFALSFDPSLLTYLSHTTTDLVDGWTILSNEASATVVVSGANSVPFTSDGVLVELNFAVNVEAAEGSCGDLTIDYGLLNEGEYCVAPASATFCGCLKGDATRNGDITATDATQVLRYIAGMGTTPNEITLCNADTTCNGVIAPLDAVRILEYNVGQIQDYCTASARSTSADVSVTLPEQALTVNEPLTIPLILGDTTGAEIKGFVLTLDYDPDTLLITDLDPTGSLLADLDWQYAINRNEPGQVRIAAAGFTALTGSGTLLNLVGSVRHWGQTELVVTELLFNEGLPRAVLSETPTKYSILGFGIEPPGVALGLEIPQLEIVEVCCGELELEWREPALDLVLPGNPLILDPPPQLSTYYEARITNPISLETLVRRAHVLVPVFPFPLDYNSDGLNTFEDLYMLLPGWGQALAIDPNGDGRVDIRDFLYINVSDK